MIKLIFSVHPGGGYVLHDRMVELTHNHLEGMPGTMTGRTIDAGDVGFVLENFPFDTVPKIRGSPPQSDHFVVSVPVPKSIVGGMDEYQPSTLMNELNCRLFGLLSPFPPVVVENDRLMRTLEGIPIFPCLVIRPFVFFISRFF